MGEAATSILFHDDTTYLRAVLSSLGTSCPTFAFVSRSPWHGEVGDWEAAAEVARQTGVVVVLGDWHTEEQHRHLSDRGRRDEDGYQFRVAMAGG